MRILLVEDDVSVSDTLKSGLEAAGYAVTPAYEADKAREALQSSGFDLVLLDLELPDGSGLDILKQLRDDSNPVPVIITTARAELDSRVTGLDIGADDYMVKPIELPELLARIRSIGRRTADTAAMHMQIADLVVDMTARSVTRGDTPIDLTQRELDLLAYLMQHRGETITREMIAQDVWGLPEHAAPIDNSVAVHMSHLRDKVDKGFEPNLIRTVRGEGYTMDLPMDD